MRNWQATTRPAGRQRRLLPRPFRLRTARVCVAVLLAAVAFAAGPPPVRAEERADEFVKGLQARGLDELTLDYLGRMATSRLADEGFRRRIPYYRGIALLSLSRRAADPDERSRRLGEARGELARFAEVNPASVEGAEAQIQLGGVLVELGRQSASAAAALPSGAAYDAQRDRHRAKARGYLSDAATLFRSVAAVYLAELEKVPPTLDANDRGGQVGRRKVLRAGTAQAQYLAANAKFELAQTYSPDAAAYRQLHESAASELSAVYDRYASSYTWGYYARLDEGRCYQALGQYQLALGCYQDILSQSSLISALRGVMARTYACQAECLLAQEKYDAAIEGCQAWLRDAKGGEARQPEWLAVRFQLAEALRQKGTTLRADSLDGRRLLAEARDAYRLVAALPGAQQSAARAAMAALRQGAGDARAEPRTFTEAYELGEEALTSANVAKQALPVAERNNPDAVAKLKTQISEGWDDARHYFQVALSLVDDDTDLAALNDVRFYLSWLYWEAGDYYRAAVLGDFLARRYSDHPKAIVAARIALISYERLQQQALEAGEDRAQTRFAAQRMANVAEFVTRRWPGTRDAEAALSVLINYAIRDDRVDDARRLLAGVPPAARPRFELQLGISMWGRYLELSQQDTSTRPDDASLRPLKDAAVGYLRNGFNAARGGRQISESSAAAGVYLAQALVGDGEYRAAIELLEDRTAGPLTLIAQRHPAASRPEYVIQAYETALRAYVSATPPQSQKAIDAVQALEEAVQSAGGRFADQLTRIYIGLGVQLSRQIDELRGAGRERDAARLAAAFAEFLDRIAARQQGVSWSTRQWVAQSYYSLGAAVRAGPSSAGPIVPTGAARRFLSKARDAYQQMLAATEEAGTPPNDAAVLTAKYQLGECYRELGQFQQALDTFSAVLSEKESSLSVQRAAAYAYQQRGQVEGVQWLERAIYGGYKLRSTGENRIWGWLKLAQVAERAARSDARYRNAFFEARLNMARCRYLIAVQREGTAREQDLAQAQQSIRSVARLYPRLGGPLRLAQFDELLKEIQRVAGEPQNGLQEFATGNGE